MYGSFDCVLLSVYSLAIVYSTFLLFLKIPILVFAKPASYRKRTKTLKRRTGKPKPCANKITKTKHYTYTQYRECTLFTVLPFSDKYKSICLRIIFDSDLLRNGYGRLLYDDYREVTIDRSVRTSDGTTDGLTLSPVITDPGTTVSALSPFPLLSSRSDKARVHS